jgi:hypothetical protein
MPCDALGMVIAKQTSGLLSRPGRVETVPIVHNQPPTSQLQEKNFTHTQLFRGCAAQPCHRRPGGPGAGPASPFSYVPRGTMKLFALSYRYSPVGSPEFASTQFRPEAGTYTGDVDAAVDYVCSAYTSMICAMAPSLVARHDIVDKFRTYLPIVSTRTSHQFVSFAQRDETTNSLDRSYIRPAYLPVTDEIQITNTTNTMPITTSSITKRTRTPVLQWSRQIVHLSNIDLNDHSTTCVTRRSGLVGRASPPRV